MKIQSILSIAALFTLLLPLTPVAAIPLAGVCDVLGNAPIGADTLVNIRSTDSTETASVSSFAPPIQSKVNQVGATFSATSLSGSQTLGSATIEVDPTAAKAAFEVMSSTPGSNPPAVIILTTALGGNDSAQQLAKSMQGLRRSNGTIDPIILTNAVSSYNSYIRYSISSSQITQKPTSELNGFISSLPAGQKVTQVILGKLIEAAQ